MEIRINTINDRNHEKQQTKNQNQSRRQFVQQTAMATGAFLTVPMGVERMANVHGEQNLNLLWWAAVVVDQEQRFKL